MTLSDDISPVDADRAYPLDVAAERAGVCIKTLRNEARDGNIILRRIRRRTVVTATDLAAYLKSRPSVGAAA